MLLALFLGLTIRQTIREIDAYSLVLNQPL